MLTHSNAPIGGFDWKTILDLGADPSYFRIHEWLSEEGLLGMVVSEFKAYQQQHSLSRTPPITLHFRPLTMWLVVMLQELQQWPFRTTSYRIGSDLSARCFVGIPNLVTRAPTQQNIYDFVCAQTPIIINMFQAVADSWILCRRDLPNSRHWKTPGWRNLLDSFCERRDRPFILQELDRALPDLEKDYPICPPDASL